MRHLAVKWASTVVFILVVGLIFYFVPNAKVRFRDVWMGAVLTGLLWRGALFGFSWYVRDMSRLVISTARLPPSWSSWCGSTPAPSCCCSGPKSRLPTPAFAAIARRSSLLRRPRASSALVLFSLTFLSVADEVKLGRDAQRQLRARVPHVGGPVAEYVASVGRRLGSQAGGPRYPYSFSVANYREINAFALPGGPVWINRGTLEAAEDDSQVAGVLAHEVAHIARRHAAAQISKGILANGLLGLLGALLGNIGARQPPRPAPSSSRTVT